MSRILTIEQIKEAKQLRKQGHTKRQLARLFEVAETTIWDNVFRSGKVIKRHQGDKPIIYSYKKIKGVIMVVNKFRSDDLTSLQVSEMLQIPIEEVNFIYSHYPPK